MNKTPKEPSNIVSQSFPHADLTASHELVADDDTALVAQAQEGDMRAFDALVLRHRDRIFAMICQMTHNEADAWDLSQEVFIKAWQGLRHFESKSKFSTWLYRIAHNAFYDWSRRRKITSSGELNDALLEQDQIDPLAIAVPLAPTSPDAQLDHDELRHRIELALSSLSAEHRETVLLKDVHGLSYKEIATTMQCTMGTVMSRLFYARQKLQALLKDEHESR